MKKIIFYSGFLLLVVIGLLANTPVYAAETLLNSQKFPLSLETGKYGRENISSSDGQLTFTAFRWGAVKYAKGYNIQVFDTTGDKVFETDWYSSDKVCTNNLCEVILPMTLSPGIYTWQVAARNVFRIEGRSEPLVFAIQEESSLEEAADTPTTSNSVSAPANTPEPTTTSYSDSAPTSTPEPTTTPYSDSLPTNTSEPATILYSDSVSTNAPEPAVITRLYPVLTTTAEPEPKPTNTPEPSSSTTLGLGSNKYDDTDTAWTYNGNWITNTGADPYSSTFSTAIGDYAEIVINGSQFVLTYTANKYRGYLDIYIDGVKIETLDQYSLITNWQSVWTSASYADSEHTLKFVHVSGGLGNLVEIDAIEVFGVDDTTPTPTQTPLPTATSTHTPTPIPDTSTVYYVDNNCAHNGNGQAQSCASSRGASGPFNSLLAASVVVVGDQSDNKLLLKRGETYQGRFIVSGYGTEGHPFTVSAYGTGNRPIITGGRENIMVNCANCKYIVMDGLELSHPERYGALILYPAGNITIRNSYIHHASTGITVYGSSNNVIEGNEISWNNGDGIKLSVGDESSPHPAAANLVSNNKVHHNLRYGILAQAYPAYRLKKTRIYQNESYNNSTGIYLVYANNSEVYENNLHDNGKDCQATDDCAGEPYGFAVQSGSYNSFYDNIIARTHDVGIGIYGSQAEPNKNSDGNKLYRNVVYDTLTGWKRDINWQAWPGNSVGNDNQIYNNIFYSRNGEGVNFVIGDSNPNISGNVAYNNIFYGGSAGVYFESKSTNAGWTFANNIFAGNADQSIYASRRYGGLTLNNNIYYKDAGGTLVVYDGESYTAANIGSLDSLAITSDPKFVGTSNWYGFRLQDGSPAIDSGVSLRSLYGLGFNPDNTRWPATVLDQNDHGEGWEIGPFVHKDPTDTP